MRSLFQAIVLSWTFFNPGTEAIKNLADVPCGRPKEVQVVSRKIYLHNFLFWIMHPHT